MTPSALFCATLYSVLALEGFRYFRCDSCRASLHQIDKALVSISIKRAGPLAEHEYVDLMEGVCRSKMTKTDYGVKTFEGRSYLFGPGVKDHINGEGFGQMGMGDYDMRLRSYCTMFVEQFEETTLYKEFRDNGKILVDRHCEVECQSDSSGTGPTHRNTVAVEQVIEKESDESQEYSQLVEAARRLSTADKIRLQEEPRRILEDLDDRLEL